MSLTRFECYRFNIIPDQGTAFNLQNVCCEIMLLSNLYWVLIKEQQNSQNACCESVSYLIYSEQLINYKYLSKENTL